MKLQNSIRPIRYLLLLSGLLALASCRQNETQSLSEYLDYVIENKHIFEAEKEERISRLRNLLGVSNLTPEQEYEVKYEAVRRIQEIQAGFGHPLRRTEPRNRQAAGQQKADLPVEHVPRPALLFFGHVRRGEPDTPAPSDRPNSRATCFLSTTRPTTVISSTMPR